MPLAMTGVLAAAGCGVFQQAQAQSVASSISVYGLIDTMVWYSDNNRGDQRLAENFVGVSAPANLPEDIVQRLHQQLQGILQQPAVRGRLDAQGFVLAERRPDEFAAYVRQQAQAWGPVVAATGATLS